MVIKLAFAQIEMVKDSNRTCGEQWNIEYLDAFIIGQISSKQGKCREFESILNMGTTPALVAMAVVLFTGTFAKYIDMLMDKLFGK